MAFHWTCPYCNRDTTITGTHEAFKHHFELSSAEGYRGIAVSMIVCPNPDCRKFTLTAFMYEFERTQYQSGAVTWKEGDLLQTWRLIPPSTARVFPDYVAKPIRDDYLGACLIRDLSPKASATLSRRCLQGIIRDFWGVSKARLVDEIEAIRDKTDALTWDAIDAVRKIGNIGAHMEKDINVIVDVELNEAQLLIELIETLVTDWYVARHDRQERLKGIVAISGAKAAAKVPAPKARS